MGVGGLKNRTKPPLALADDGREDFRAIDGKDTNTATATTTTLTSPSAAAASSSSLASSQDAQRGIGFLGDCADEESLPAPWRSEKQHSARGREAHRAKYLGAREGKDDELAEE